MSRIITTVDRPILEKFCSRVDGVMALVGWDLMDCIPAEHCSAERRERNV